MPLPILLMVLLAALLHAAWNFMIKAAGERELVAWWSILAGVLIFAPVFLWKPGIPKEIWPYAIASGLVETAYLLLLVYAYRLADFSLVYPLARGTAPALLTVGALVFLKEKLSAWGAVGLAVLLVGLVIIAAGPLLSRRNAAIHVPMKGILAALGVAAPPSLTKGVLAALGVAVCIATYSTIDAAAVQIMNPLTYNVLILLLLVLFMTPVVFWRYGPRRVWAAGRREWKRFTLLGSFTVLTYMLVLVAYSYGHVSYAGALREVSVVFGALLGWRFLGEKLGALRLAGAAVIAAGIVIIAVG